MDLSGADSGPVTTDVARVPQPQPYSLAGSAGRVIWSAVVWLFVSGVPGSFLVVAGSRTVAALGYPRFAWSTHAFPGDGTLPGSVELAIGQAILFAVARRNARRVADGDVEAGLGNRPVRRRGLLIVLLVLLPFCNAAWSLLLRTLGASIIAGPSGPVASALPHVDGGFVISAIEIAIIAPIVEEMFFRGWVWSGLRRHWSASATAVTASVIFLAAHIGSPLTRPVYLVPATVLMALSRQFCGSIRASMAVHLLNNGLVIGLLIAAMAVQ